MRMLVSAVLALGLLIAPLAAKSPSELATFLSKHIIRIHMTGPILDWGTCTAFGVNKKRGWGITAEHCVVSDQGFDYRVVDDALLPITVLARSSTIGPPQPKDDLALITGEIFFDLDSMVALTIVPTVGSEVATSGFAFGELRPFFLYTRIARAIPEWFTMEMAGGALQGMSGAPVVNKDGLVAGVLTKSSYGHTVVIGSWHFQELFQHALQIEESKKDG